jgi:hypothetical protein
MDLPWPAVGALPFLHLGHAVQASDSPLGLIAAIAIGLGTVAIGIAAMASVHAWQARRAAGPALRLERWGFVQGEYVAELTVPPDLVERVEPCRWALITDDGATAPVAIRAGARSADHSLRLTCRSQPASGKPFRLSAVDAAGTETAGVDIPAVSI